MFWGLIGGDNITFKLQFSEKLHEYNEAAKESGGATMTYEEYRDQKVCGELSVNTAIFLDLSHPLMNSAL